MRVLTVGGAMIDTIALIDDERIERMAMSNAQSSFLLLEEGRKVEAAKITQHCGGGAINTAVCFSKLGNKTATCVVLGQDQRAEVVKQRLEDEKIETQWLLQNESESTGSSIIVASHEKDAAIFTARGANTTLDYAQLPSEMFVNDLVYITGLSNESADSFRPIVRAAKKAGAKVAANPGIRQLTSRTPDFLEAIKDIDLLSVNRKEASSLIPTLIGQKLTGEPISLEEIDLEELDLLRKGLSFADHDLDLGSFFIALQQIGAHNILVTDGKYGAYFFNEGKLHYCSAVKAEIAGTAGAGDAYASTVAAVFFSKGDVGLALRSAAANAASVVGYLDTQTGLLSKDELQARIEAVDDEFIYRSWSVA